MEPLARGSVAPPLPEAEAGPRAVVFYKVTCPTCQVAAPAMERLFRSAPRSFAAVVQDPPERAKDFNETYGTTFSPVPDTEPYDLSNAFGVRTVPTLFILDEAGRVEDVAESWDRQGWNRATARLAKLTGLDLPEVSEDGDGLPPFRPG
jgi:peroxiredoxin